MPILLGLSIFLITTSCSQKNNAEATKAGLSTSNLRVWTSRVVPADAALLKQFESRNSLTVSLEILPDEEIIKRLAGNDKPDLIIFSDFLFAEQAKRKNLLQTFVDKKLQQDVPIKYTDASNQWIGISKWALGVVYARNQRTWEGLTYDNMSNKGPVAWSNATQPFLTTLAAALLTPASGVSANEVVEGLKKNHVSTVFDTDASSCLAVAEGKVPAALVNASAFFRWKNSGDPAAFAASDKLSLIFPVNEQGKSCYHLTVAAIPVGAARRSEAIMLVEFLSNQESQAFYSESAFEFPVNIFALPSDLLMQNGVFLEMPLDWAEVNQQIEAAQKLFE